MFQRQEIGTETARLLSGDPFNEPPIQFFRVVVGSMATFVLVLAAGLAMVTIAPKLFGYSSVVVASGSMEPTIRVADVVVIAPDDGVDLPLGTVINFDYDDTTRLHRISEVTAGGYRTSGDANRSVDSEVVTSDQVRGVGIVVVPFVGMPARWVEDGRWLRLVAFLAGLTVVMYLSRSSWMSETPTRIRT
nr:hypothetical protein [uncultured bacterium]